jgi:hypothetical protein
MRLPLAVGVMTVVLLIGGALTAQQTTPPPPKGQAAEEIFKNVQALKGISVDDFLGTMGVMSAAVGYDCSECHIGAGTDKVDWAADNQKKVIARKMVLMVAAINKENFSGRQMVTCWSCHHGRDRPSTTPSFETVYGPGSQEMDDVLAQESGQPSADSILDKYIQAIGGAQKLATVKSYIEQGTSVGFGGFGGGGVVHIYAKFPDKRTTLIEFKDTPDRGDSTRTYNGTAGWIKTPLAVLTEYQLSGGELNGARLDAMMSFPAQIKQTLTNLKVSLPTSISDLPGPSSQTSKETAEGLGKDRVVNVVQGTGPGGTLATLYFDQTSGLLLRMVRYSRSPIGRMPTQVDFSDYRDVGNGVKMPFRLTFAWLDGRDAIQIDKVQTNVPIEEKVFGRPGQMK